MAIPQTPLLMNKSSNEVITTVSDSPAQDAFGRTRTSNPETLFDSKQIFDNAPLFWDDIEFSGSGTNSVWSGDRASSTLSVSASTAGRRIRQTFMCFNYQPGKSFLIFLSGVLGNLGGGAGITRCMGYYNDENGILFKDNEGVLEVMLRSNVSGSVVETSFAQSNWNMDKLDGSGPSGFTIDGTKAQLIVIDFQWLSVGRVRAGFEIDGKIIYVHEFNHTNVISGAYMSTPNLPVRCEIENDGTGVASELEHICSTVISEGGTTDLGVTRYSSTFGASNTGALTDTTYLSMALRIQDGKFGQTIKILEAGLQVLSSNTTLEWCLIFNPSVAGTALTWVNETSGSLQKAVGVSDNVVTGGIPVGGGFGESSKNTPTSSGNSVDSALRLGASIAGTPDVIALGFRPNDGSTNGKVEGAILYRELT